MTARVLVVDDVEVNVKLLEAKLASEYFSVVSANNGPSALEIAGTELPDIILLDVMMPRMDGFEVCRRLKANALTADIPVVMVTALSDVSDRLRGLEAGADDFLTKPVNDTALFARVRSLVRLKRMMDELRLREEVCGRFSPAGTADGPTADLDAARILLVAEQGFATSRIVDTLNSVTASVIRASSCAEAQSLLDDSVELVIASLSMPDGDVLRLVAQWRANESSRQLPVLLVADDSELSRLAKGLDLGANDYLVRPVDRNELLARVRTQIRRKRLAERLRANYRRSLSLALTDELTGLYNRRYVFAHLTELLGRRTEGGNETAVLLFDVDHFKQVNDRHGHPAGDEVLRELGRRGVCRDNARDQPRRRGCRRRALPRRGGRRAVHPARIERKGAGHGQRRDCGDRRRERHDRHLAEARRRCALRRQACRPQSGHCADCPAGAAAGEAGGGRRRVLSRHKGSSTRLGWRPSRPLTHRGGAPHRRGAGRAI
jgi:two-component system cell cycle response regulator